jgi:hypothetical protein
MSYGVNYPQLYFHAAQLVDKIIKGTAPALPILIKAPGQASSMYAKFRRCNQASIPTDVRLAPVVPLLPLHAEIRGGKWFERDDRPETDLSSVFSVINNVPWEVYFRATYSPLKASRSKKRSSANLVVVGTCEDSYTIQIGRAACAWRGTCFRSTAL